MAKASLLCFKVVLNGKLFNKVSQIVAFVQVPDCFYHSVSLAVSKQAPGEAAELTFDLLIAQSVLRVGTCRASQSVGLNG